MPSSYIFATVIICFPIIIALAFWYGVRGSGKKAKKIVFEEYIAHFAPEDAEVSWNDINIQSSNIDNFRAVGGYSTADGKKMKRGLYFRSGSLHDADKEDIRLLENLQIRTIIDVRSASESSRNKDRLPSGVRFFNCPSDNHEGVIDENGVGALFHRNKLEEHVKREYLINIQDGAKNYARMFEILADEGNVPVLVHCEQGKDRTGIFTALLLDLLGVRRQTIIAEYSLSNYSGERLFRKMKERDTVLKRMDVDLEEIKMFAVSNPVWISTVLKWVDDHGGTEAYLVNRGGMDPEAISRIKDIYLE